MILSEFDSCDREEEKLFSFGFKTSLFLISSFNSVVVVGKEVMEGTVVGSITSKIHCRKERRRTMKSGGGFTTKKGVL
jgi:hypothetical protein